MNLDLLSILLGSLISIIVAGFGFFIKWISIRKKYIYEVKQKAIIESLYFLDNYFSTLNWDNGEKKPIRIEGISDEYLTFTARKCYNDLLVTCKNKNLPLKFIKFLKTGMDINQENVLEYKNICRKELGFNKIKIKEENKDYPSFIIYVKDLNKMN